MELVFFMLIISSYRARFIFFVCGKSNNNFTVKMVEYRGGIDREELIKQAAAELFVQKGFEATKSRDIAQKAGVNLALINYYFKSKSQLFNIVMTDMVNHFVVDLIPIFDSRELELKPKLEKVIDTLFDNVGENPNLPMFLISEVGREPSYLLRKVAVCRYTYIYKQLEEVSLDPNHIIVNVISLVLFPFIAGEILEASFDNRADYDLFLEERRALVKSWSKTMIEK